MLNINRNSGQPLTMLGFVLIVSSSILIPVFVFGGTLNGATNTGFSFTPSEGDSRPVYAIGDVNDVLHGHVSPSTRENHWSAKGIIGFGAATVGSISALGEAFIANGNAFVRQTDNTTHNYYETVSEGTFRTPFSVFVSDEMASDGRASFTAENPAASNSISLMKLYHDVDEAVDGSPFCFHGFVRFHRMHGIAVSKAPIYGEALFGEIAGGYYTKPNFNIPGAYGLIFGCAANFSNVADKELFDKLSRALYINPKDTNYNATSLQVHSHALTLKNDVEKLEQVSPNNALDVYHLLSDSLIQSINVKVFKMHNSAKLIERKTPDEVDSGAASISRNYILNLQCVAVTALSIILSGRLI